VLGEAFPKGDPEWAQVEALLEIKARLNGSEGCLADWTVTASEGQAVSPSLVCNWTGITCQPGTSDVISLSLIRPPATGPGCVPPRACPRRWATSYTSRT